MGGGGSARPSPGAAQADKAAQIVSSEGPVDEQVRKILGPEGVKFAIDPVAGDTGTQMYQALSDEGRMLVYGSLTSKPIGVGADPPVHSGGSSHPGSLLV